MIFFGCSKWENSSEVLGSSVVDIRNREARESVLIKKGRRSGNIGNRNIGNRDIGNRNIGNRDIGNRDIGIGNRNIGNRDIGNRNIGNQNIVCLRGERECKLV